MRLTVHRSKKSRGFAATEFAFVIPLMLMVFGGIFGFGMVLWSRYVASVTLQSTLRTCVAAQNSMSANASAEMVGCVNQQFVQQAQANLLNKLCSTSPNVSQVTASLLPTGQVDQRPVYLLTASAGCTVNLPSFINFFAFNLTSLQVTARSALPFTP